MVAPIWHSPSHLCNTQAPPLRQSTELGRVSTKRDPPTARDNGTGSERRSDSGDQSVNKCHCRERTRRRLGGTSLSSEARSRKAPAKRSGWAEEAIKLPATDRKHPTRTRAGKIWRARNRRRNRDKLQVPRVRDLNTPSLSTPIGARKLEQETTCIEQGLHLPVPPCHGTLG